jgi:alkylhydroperoxidase/carboxymuconolactone decarboxylase family protein YurZ
MSQTARFQETLRRLAIFDEGFVEAGFGLGLGQASALDAKTVALLQVAVSVAIGSSAVCLQWSTARALAAGATKDEITDVLMAIVPVADLGRIVSAAPEVATALDYDVESALAEPSDRSPRLKPVTKETLAAAALLAGGYMVISGTLRLLS